MTKECPKEVIEAGKQLAKLHSLMKKVRAQISDTKDALEPATKVMVEEHGAKEMQGAAALKALTELQSATYLSLIAHESNRAVLCECSVAEPTAEQIGVRFR